MNRYAKIVERNRDGVRETWYVLFYKSPKETGAEWNGPYRDKTDAENAAHDSASRTKEELEWVY